MASRRVYKLWTITLLISSGLTVLYQLLFQDIQQFPYVIGSQLLSMGLAGWLYLRQPLRGELVLFLNTMVMTVFVYYGIHSHILTVLFLFFPPLLALLFADKRYFISSICIIGIGYLVPNLDSPPQQNAIFYICYIIYCILLAFVMQSIAKSATETAKFQEQVNVFSKAIEARDAYTQGHSRRVSLYAVAIGRLVPEIDVEELKIAGDLHDIGKIATPDSVLLKPARLTAEEYEIIKRHSVDGANLLREFGIQGPILDGVLYHHERMNGSGYPEGLSGPDIPLFARILAIADTFDAMTTTRSYRVAFPTQHAYDEIVSLSGKFYDPELVRIFQQVYPEILRIFEQEEQYRNSVAGTPGSMPDTPSAV